MTLHAEPLVATNFSFLRAASHPEELVAAAKALGLAAIGVADRNSLAGAVRMHVAAKEAGVRLMVGARLEFSDGTPDVAVFPEDRAAHGRLCRLLSTGNLRAPKGECLLDIADLARWREGLLMLVIPPARLDEACAGGRGGLAALAPGRAVAMSLWRGGRTGPSTSAACRRWMPRWGSRRRRSIWGR